MENYGERKNKKILTQNHGNKTKLWKKTQNEMKRNNENKRKELKN